LIALAGSGTILMVQHPIRDLIFNQTDNLSGWAPQQILAWGGLMRYGFQEEAERLTYKWLYEYMVTKSFVDFNEIVADKKDVTRAIDPHKVEAEYGNQGSNFRGVAREGFGWVISSYVYGLTIVNTNMKRALGTCTPWETFRKATEGRRWIVAVF